MKAQWVSTETSHMSINGGRTENNAWELDGGDNMDNGSNQTLNVYPSAGCDRRIQGAHLQLRRAVRPQWIRDGRDQHQIGRQSDFHGDVYEFLRNDDFNARNFFQPSVPEYRKNDFGYTLGGPVYIPKVYNKNKDKTFFFFSEEWHKDLVPGQTFNQPLPDAQQQMGNFADVCPAAGSIVNKTGFPDCPVNPKTGTYFPNNIVPDRSECRSDPYPASATEFGSGLSSRYIAAPAQLTNWREELVRIDHNFSDKVRLFGHFIHDSWSTETPTPLWGNGASFPTVGTNFVGPGVSVVANLAANILAHLAERVHVQLHHRSHLSECGWADAAAIQHDHDGSFQQWVRWVASGCQRGRRCQLRYRRIQVGYRIFPLEQRESRLTPTKTRSVRSWGRTIFL